MSAPPILQSLQAQDFDTPEQAIVAIVRAFNEFAGQVNDNLAGRIDTRNLARDERENLQLRSDGDGFATLRVRHNRPKTARLVTLGKLNRRNGAALGADWGWSFDWVNTSPNEVQLNFVDLPLSVDLVATVVVE